MAEDSLESDTSRKGKIVLSIRTVLQKPRAILAKESLGKILKKNYEGGREPS